MSIDGCVIRGVYDMVPLMTDRGQRLGGLRSNLAEDINPDFEELEGMIPKGERLVKIDGATCRNTVAFDARLTGIHEWRDRQ